MVTIVSEVSHNPKLFPNKSVFRPSLIPPWWLFGNECFPLRRLRTTGGFEDGRTWSLHLPTLRLWTWIHGGAQNLSILVWCEARWHQGLHCYNFYAWFNNQTIPTLLLSTFLVISWTRLTQFLISLETRRWPSDDPMDRISPSSNSLYALFSIRLWHSRFMTQYNAFVISILKQKYIWILNVIDFRSICKCMSWYRH